VYLLSPLSPIIFIFGDWSLDAKGGDGGRGNEGEGRRENVQIHIKSFLRNMEFLTTMPK